MTFKYRIVAPDPLEHHRGMFFFFVAIMGQDRTKCFVGGGVDALLIPVNCFQLLLQTDDGAVHISRLRRQILRRFMKAFRSHSVPPCFVLRLKYEYKEKESHMARYIRAVLGILIIALFISAARRPDTVPLDKIKLPPGFSISVYASGVRNAREMALLPYSTR